MPDTPTPRAPLLVMAPGDHEYLSDADAFANGRWSREAVRRLLLAELDAQRARVAALEHERDKLKRERDGLQAVLDEDEDDKTIVAHLVHQIPQSIRDAANVLAFDYASAPAPLIPAAITSARESLERTITALNVVRREGRDLRWHATKRAEAAEQARVAAYAEGQRAGLEAAIGVVRERSLYTVKTYASVYGPHTEHLACLADDVALRLQALRDTPRPTEPGGRRTPIHSTEEGADPR